MPLEATESGRWAPRAERYERYETDDPAQSETAERGGACSVFEQTAAW
jgi:hypothetical protein